MVDACLPFSKIVNFFFTKVVVPFYISTSNVWRFQVLHVLINIFYCLFEVEELPLTFLIVWVCWRYGFLCLQKKKKKKKHISLLFLKGISPGYRILDWQSFPLLHESCCLLACSVSNKKALFLFLCIYCLFSSTSAAFNIFSLSLVLGNLIMMHLGTAFLIFLMLGNLWDSWFYTFLVFVTFRKCSAIISLNNF